MHAAGVPASGAGSVWGGGGGGEKEAGEVSVVAVYDEGWSLRGLAFFVGLGVVKVRSNVVGAGSIYPWCGKRLHNLLHLRHLSWKTGYCSGV